MPTRGTSDAKGDATFTVSVDGKQIGGTFTAAASHAAGQEQSVTLNGDFGPGTHYVAVNFLNDAWGGTPSTDRNLYVDSITYNGLNTNQSASPFRHWRSPASPSAAALPCHHHQRRPRCRAAGGHAAGHRHTTRAAAGVSAEPFRQPHPDRPDLARRQQRVQRRHTGVRVQPGDHVQRPLARCSGPATRRSTPPSCRPRWRTPRPAASSGCR